MTSLATVDPITLDTPWSAHAVLGDAMNRCNPEDTIIIVWLNKDGNLSYSKNTKTQMDLSTLVVYLQALAIRVYNE